MSIKTVLLIVAAAAIGFYFLSDMAAGLFHPSTQAAGARPFILHLAVQSADQRRFIAYGAYATEQECTSEGRRLTKRPVHPVFRCQVQ